MKYKNITTNNMETIDMQMSNMQLSNVPRSDIPISGQRVVYVWMDVYGNIQENISYFTVLIATTIEEIPLYYIEEEHTFIRLNPCFIYRDPFTVNQQDIMVLCDTYYMNNLVHGDYELCEINREESIKQFIDQFSQHSLVLTQKCNIDISILTSIFIECSRYVGIDIRSRLNEYTIYTTRDTLYQEVWISRYILNTICEKNSIPHVTYEEVILIPNQEEDLSDCFSTLSSN